MDMYIIYIHVYIYIYVYFYTKRNTFSSDSGSQLRVAEVPDSSEMPFSIPMTCRWLIRVALGKKWMNKYWLVV